MLRVCLIRLSLFRIIWVFLISDLRKPSISMKKLILFIIFFFPFAYVVCAQVSVGPLAGINFSTALGGNGANQFRTGFHGGAYLKFSINDAVAIQPEMLYYKIGYKQQLSFSKSGTSADTNINHSFHLCSHERSFYMHHD